MIAFVNNVADALLHFQKPDVCDSHIWKCKMNMQTARMVQSLPHRLL